MAADSRTWKDTGVLLVLTLEARRLGWMILPARAKEETVYVRSGAAHAYVARVNTSDGGTRSSLGTRRDETGATEQIRCYPKLPGP